MQLGQSKGKIALGNHGRSVGEFHDENALLLKKTMQLSCLSCWFDISQCEQNFCRKHRKPGFLPFNFTMKYGRSAEFADFPKS